MANAAARCSRYDPFALSRARVTQVMDLLRLAPDIQEAVLDLPPVERGRGPRQERALRRIAVEPLWTAQRHAWGEVLRTSRAG